MLKKYFSQVNLEKKEKPKLLLHICCGPDLVVPLLDLKKFFKLYLYWYNPNIQPYAEYAKRYKEYIKILKLEEGDFEIMSDNENFWKDKINLLEDDKILNKYSDKEFYDKLFEYREVVWIKEDNFNNLMKEFSQMEEKNSSRCDICYYSRLFEPAKIAQKYNINFFTTTLLISPKKSVEKLNKYWKLVTQKTWVNYLSFDFRKNNWFQRASNYTKENNIWRQNYCGCLWAKNK